MSLLGDAIGRAIAERGVTSTDLAEAAGVSRRTIHDVLRGRHVPMQDTITRIATVLNLDPVKMLELRERDRHGGIYIPPAPAPAPAPKPAPKPESEPAPEPPAEAAPDPTPAPQISVARAVAMILDSVPGTEIKQRDGIMTISFDQTGQKSQFGKFLVQMARARRFLNGEGLDKPMYDDIVRGLVERYEAEACKDK